jgi:hypothetical protein
MYRRLWLTPQPTSGGYKQPKTLATTADRYRSREAYGQNCRDRKRLGHGAVELAARRAAGL